MPRIPKMPKAMTPKDTTGFLNGKVFSDNEVNMVYSMYDRMIVGGARPVGEVLKLEAIDPLKAPYFLTRREMGIFNVGGPGVVKAGDAVFELDYKEALYLGSGDREVTFESKDVKNPAQFYFNSVTAHRNYPDKKSPRQMPSLLKWVHWKGPTIVASTRCWSVRYCLPASCRWE